MDPKDENNSYDTTVTQLSKKSLKFSLQNIIYLTSTILLIIAIVFAIVVIVLSATNPCELARCHQNATCINHLFRAECTCLNGYAGNGIDHCDECGNSFYENNVNRMGLNAVPYSWPAYSMLEFNYKSLVEILDEKIFTSYYFFCGATLINRRFLLTSASCLIKNVSVYDWFYESTFNIDILPNSFNPSSDTFYKIYLGMKYLVYFGIDLEEMFAEKFERAIIHPDYDPITRQNDIALIKLSYDVMLDHEIQPACLPSKTLNLTMKNESVSVGFGITNPAYMTRFSLTNMISDLFNDSMCSQVDPYRAKNSTIQFCAGEYDDEDGLELNYCAGDIGSALYVLDKVNGKDKYVTAGIMSYNDGCETAHAPSVYTRITEYLDWIAENSKY